MAAWQCQDRGGQGQDGESAKAGHIFCDFVYDLSGWRWMLDENAGKLLLERYAMPTRADVCNA